jgi:hypothetical protein
MFLLERAHVVRAPFLLRRVDDWIWVSGMIFIIFAFGGLSIWAYVTPHANISPNDGRCRIGRSAITSYLILAFDAIINVTLTLTFVLFLRPVLSFSHDNSTAGQLSEHIPTSNRPKRSIANIVWFGMNLKEYRSEQYWIGVKAMLRRNVIGSALMFLASAANLTAFYIDGAVQLGFLCLVTCMADGMLVATILISVR